ncbi:MAG: hypothetical protein GQ557_00940 [Mycoplasmataceae bacterium]|nr:hypothetical protein [Mycoplasmataceae bacterium]
MFKIINTVGETRIGKRKINQDVFVIFNNKHSFLITALADGMGGHNGGEIASQFAIKCVQKYFNNLNFATLTQEQSTDLIIFNVKKIQKSFIDYAKLKPELKDMGTTLNLNIFANDKLFSLNIGDSRTMQLLNREIVEITEDHNLSTLARKNPLYAKFSNYSNLLTSSLGPIKETKVDLFVTHFSADGYIIQTCDGVHNYVSNNEIKKILLSSKTDLKEKADNIIQKALKKGSKDNVTVVLVEYGKK